jgi:hypothetical protein
VERPQDLRSRRPQSQPSTPVPTARIGEPPGSWRRRRRPKRTGRARATPRPVTTAVATLAGVVAIRSARREELRFDARAVYRELRAVRRGGQLAGRAVASRLHRYGSVENTMSLRTQTQVSDPPRHCSRPHCRSRLVVPVAARCWSRRAIRPRSQLFVIRRTCSPRSKPHPKQRGRT